MPKRGTDENEDKQMKPKQIAKIVLDIYDNGYCDRDLFEFYINDETKKRKKDLCSSTKQLIQTHFDWRPIP